MEENSSGADNIDAEIKLFRRWMDMPTYQAFKEWKKRYMEDIKIQTSKDTSSRGEVGQAGAEQKKNFE